MQKHQIDNSIEEIDMAVSIQVTACDNELFLIAGQHDKSYLLANIKSGNNKSVDYELNIKEGQFGGTKNVGNPNYPIKEKNTTYLPHGEYNLIVLGADWGASNKNFKVDMTGGSPSPYHAHFPNSGSHGASGWAPEDKGTFKIPKRKPTP